MIRVYFRSGTSVDIDISRDVFVAWIREAERGPGGRFLDSSPDGPLKGLVINVDAIEWFGDQTRITQIDNRQGV